MIFPEYSHIDGHRISVEVINRNRKGVEQPISLNSREMERLPGTDHLGTSSPL